MQPQTSFLPFSGHNPSNNSTSEPTALNRREFLVRAALGAAALGSLPLACRVAEGAWPPALTVFSKVYQEVSLSFEEAAALTAEAGLDGIDCPVRPKGEIEPER